MVAIATKTFDNRSMLITGHDALKSVSQGNNGIRHKYEGTPIKSIEIDVRKRGGELFATHRLLFFKSRTLRLSAVFEYAAAHQLIMNVDVKSFGIIGDICALAEAKGVGNLIYFTGRFMPSDMAGFTLGTVYVNEEFYATKAGIPSVGNLAKIKAYLDSFGSDRILGINTGYRKVTDEFVSEAKRLELGLSLYTVDTEAALRKVIAWQPDNITTNNPALAIKLAGEKK